MNPEDIKNASEAIKNASAFGIEAIKFIRVLTDEPMKELSGILSDKLKFYRWRNQQQILLKAAEYLRSNNILTRKIPLRELIPLLEYSSMEDEELLQDLWAGILANSANSNSSNRSNLVFIEILKSLSKMEAEILQVISSIPNCMNPNGVILTTYLPATAQMMTPPPSGARSSLLPNDDVTLALANLDRLGCISIVKSIGGDQMFEFIKCTELGIRLVQICTVAKTV
ncbi:MAG: DUF4393 domain-containing protein [Bdellovibrionales bacterium]|nr:DUF4393 domain-containing protein [Bdellovibrionales bacterium]